MSEKIVIITGGFGALGKVVAKAFADNGDIVVRVDFAQSPLESNPSLNGMDIGGVNISSPQIANEVIGKIIQKYGKINCLINIAGGFVWETINCGNPENFAKMFEMNLLTCLNMSQNALPHLLNQELARIVNIGAGAAIKAETGMASYAASKSGVHRLTESMAAEFANNNITINAILPSIIDTPTNRNDMPDADFSTWVSPQAIADSILFLCSNGARSINGALIPLTKGAN